MSRYDIDPFVKYQDGGEVNEYLTPAFLDYINT